MTTTPASPVASIDRWSAGYPDEFPGARVRFATAEFHGMRSPRAYFDHIAYGRHAELGGMQLCGPGRPIDVGEAMTGSFPRAGQVDDCVDVPTQPDLVVIRRMSVGIFEVEQPGTIRQIAERAGA
ncbi:hypothetical protein IQ251_12675 [Saccharopolyspora sp. HNM0983]|uniref:Uncharacterized protein n=1 Tax=Saccharopolyspora montiporae TaxID=2781240 RepID=A0A929B8N5_9PSEU|nr:hypothetical protein [Saccharopolyspora sp. HNM0983]MBE9375299.1 hypothetical protein [Saccharopolyspora sp. HNM0983]